MKIIKASSPKWATQDRSSIELKVEFESIGEVPFGASPNDSTEYGRELYARALAGEFGQVAAYEPPPPQPVQVPQSVTMRQARLALLNAGLLSSVDAAIDALPSPDKEKAMIEWEYSQDVQRYNGFVSLLAPQLGLNETQIDDLFIAAAAL